MTETFAMSSKELDRLTTIKAVISCNLTQVAAARHLGLSERQIHRLKHKYLAEGDAGFISNKRGKPSNRRYSNEFKTQALNLISEHFDDYGPTLAAEKLAEYFNIQVSKETARQWMIAAGIWRVHSKPERKLHPTRERRPCFGELIQIDGSDHAWFEGRGPKCTLLVFIDDATSTITALRFVEAETTLGYFAALKSHLSNYGVPMSFYADKHGVFKVNHPESKVGNGLTQFGRALNTLSIEMIFAHSPQAKGRVERVNETLQDRLVKDLRFHRISDIESGNAFLEKFRVKFNQRFEKSAKSAFNAHRALSQFEKIWLNKTLSIQTQRTISKDMLVRYNNSMFKIIAPGQTNRLSLARVTVCEELSGKIKIFYKNQSLHYVVYKKGLHTDQIFNRKEMNRYLSKLHELERRWDKDVASL